MKGQKWKVVLQYLLLCALAGELLYHEVLAGFLFIPLLPAYVLLRKRKKQEEEVYQKTMQLRDGLNSLQAALEAGYSLENAFREARKELSAIYPEEAYICGAFDQMLRKMGNGIAVEEAFSEIAGTSGLEDAENVAESIVMTKRLGGDLLQVIRATVGVIASKLEVKREIRTITAQKRMEGNIMLLVPPGMLVYFRVFSPDYLRPLYEGGGRVVMTLLFAGYLVMLGLMEHFTNIEM